MRGFWYPLSPQEGILATQTNLKSCCLKAPAKIQEQIFVKGDVVSFFPQKALTLEGIFRIEPSYNVEGQLVQLFVLEKAKEVHQSNFFLYLAIFSIFIISMWAFYFYWSRSNQFSSRER